MGKAPNRCTSEGDQKSINPLLCALQVFRKQLRNLQLMALWEISLAILRLFSHLGRGNTTVRLHSRRSTVF